ncbi:hypothetical protein BDV29DRAFT_186649 [Aspergillus leporis]|uniref:Uncharacterized protein n=1 Tax=Aspergillus leporis TaxID=41062 RepID=A0A5N5WHK4_9EURO|nr:hypothetical protein BDV29DRAFT_186649 [Aspergillus leporis]
MNPKSVSKGISSCNTDRFFDHLLFSNLTSRIGIHMQFTVQTLIHLELVVLLSSFAAGKLVDVPDDTDKPTPNVICFSLPWYRVTLFFLVNYVAHAATIMPFPGQPKLLAFLDFLTALLLPYSGLWRGASAIWRSSFFSRRCRNDKSYNQLEEAARAGALAVIIRSESWLPRLPDQVVKISATSFKPICRTEQPRGSPVLAKYPEELAFQVDADNISTISTISNHGNPCHARRRRPILPTEMAGLSLVNPAFGEIRRVHGLLHLPDDFTIAILPYNAKVKFNGPDNDYQPYGASPGDDTARPYQHSNLASTYSLPRVLIAILQVFFALYSLTTPTHEAEIDKYGFAAFSFTVLPYLIMSLTNLTASLLIVSYPTLYLVRSEEMDEAERRGAKFDGVVGLLDQDVTDDVITATCKNRCRNQCFVFNNLPANFTVGDSEEVEYEFSPFACSPFKTTGNIFNTTTQKCSCGIFCVFLTLIPLAVIGGLTGFKGKESCKLDQISLMLWFGFDCVYGLAVPVLRQYLLERFLNMKGHQSLAFDRDSGNDGDFHLHKKYLEGARSYIGVVFCIVFVFCGPSVWGFITVVKMLYDWGACFYLTYP